MDNKQSARNAYLAASKLGFDKQLQEDALFEYAKLSYELDFNVQALEATRAQRKSAFPSGARTFARSRSATTSP